MAKIVVARGKFAEMQRRGISQSKVSPLKLICVDCLFQLKVNRCKSSLLQRISLTNLVRAKWVQDVRQKIFNLFTNGASQCRSNSNMVQ